MKCFNCRAELPDGYYDPASMQQPIDDDDATVRIVKRCPNCKLVLEIEQVKQGQPYKPPMELK